MANERRLEFVEFIDISVLEASLDLPRYHQLASPGINYDRVQRPLRCRRIFDRYLMSCSRITAPQSFTTTHIADLKAVIEHNQVPPEDVDREPCLRDDGGGE